MAAKDTTNPLVSKILGDNEDLEKYLSRLPQSKRERIGKKMERISTGVHAISPIVCKGPDKCPIFSHCPIKEVRPDGTISLGPLSEYPIEDACVLEAMFIRERLSSYISYLNIQDNNPIEMSIANDLALMDLYVNRATMILSGGDSQNQGRDLLRIDISSIDGYGEKAVATTTTQIHPAHTIIERIQHRREKLIDKLMESRKAKVELAFRRGETKVTSDLMLEIQSLRQMLLENASQPKLVTQDLAVKKTILLKD